MDQLTVQQTQPRQASLHVKHKDQRVLKRPHAAGLIPSPVPTDFAQQIRRPAHLQRCIQVPPQQVLRVFPVEGPRNQRTLRLLLLRLFCLQPPRRIPQVHLLCLPVCQDARSRRCRRRPRLWEPAPLPQTASGVAARRSIATSKSRCRHRKNSRQCHPLRPAPALPALRRWKVLEALIAWRTVHPGVSLNPIPKAAASLAKLQMHAQIHDSPLPKVGYDHGSILLFIGP